MISPNGDPRSPRRDWRRSPTLAIAFAAVWLTIQLAIPLSQLGSDEPSDRFVWRMFTTFVPAVEFTVSTPDGTTSVDLAEIVARLRADLPLKRSVPPHLCRVIEDAVSVSWSNGYHKCDGP